MRTLYNYDTNTHVLDGLYLTESHSFIPIIKVKKINLSINTATAAKFNILKCEPMGTDSVLESASSGSQRNCGFGLFCIGLVVRLHGAFLGFSTLHLFSGLCPGCQTDHTSLSTLLLHFSNQLNFIHL